MHRPQDQRSRSAKPTTIHGYAQSGDLLGFQKLLRENPSLLNEGNPVVRFYLCPSGFFIFFPKILYFGVLGTVLFDWFGLVLFRIIRFFDELGFVIWTT